MLPLELTVPFMTLRGWPNAAGLLAVSAAVSALYLLPTVIAFEATRRITAPAPVRFIARNTPIIFLAHMPLFLALHPILVAWHVGYAGRVIVQLLVCLVGLGAVSEAIQRLLGRSVVYAELARRRSPERLARRFAGDGPRANGAGAEGARAFRASAPQKLMGPLR